MNPVPPRLKKAFIAWLGKQWPGAASRTIVSRDADGNWILMGYYAVPREGPSEGFAMIHVLHQQDVPGDLPEDLVKMFLKKVHGAMVETRDQASLAREALAKAGLF